MGIIVAIISFFLGMFIFLQGLGSLFVGLPMASRARARESKKVYVINILWTTALDVVVIVLMATVLIEFLAWIIIAYFIIPLILFFVKYVEIENEASVMISEEIERDTIKAKLLYDLINSFDDEKNEKHY